MPRGLLATFFLLAFLTIFSFTQAKALSDHLIITQIQIASTENANDEFVELYNPTDLDIDLTNLRLTRTNSTGSTVQNLVASLSGTLASHHYFLVSHPTYTTIPVVPDKTYSASSSGITTNSTIVLYATDHITVIDKVGFGTAQNYETSPAPNPPSGQSLVRTGFIDTDDNSADFTILTSPALHNSTSVDTVPTATPQPTDQPQPTSSPTPTPTPFITPEPTVKVVTPTPIPTSAPSPTPSIYPTSHFYFRPHYCFWCYRFPKFHWFIFRR